MPIYAYRCSHCGHAQDVLQRMSDPVLTVCPSCGQPTYVKQVTAAGFQLKGSGWYVTDFRDGKKPAPAADADKAGVKEGAAAGASGADAAPAGDAAAKTGDAPKAGDAGKKPEAAASAPAAPSPAPAPAAPGGGKAAD